MNELNVERPIKRGRLRSKLGKEYFILKRKIKWISHNSKYASKKTKEEDDCNYSIIKHRSFLLRPLKNVDMRLQVNKVTNLRVAISKIDEIIIYPNQTLSVWKQVGRPTKKKGYLEGLILHNGKINEGIGGGLCQLGNLLYWMTLHTDLDITERWRHGFDVFPDINRKIPFACGATLSYNYVDLQITNNTNKKYKINLWLDEEYLNGEIKSDELSYYKYNIVETDHSIRQQWWGGYTRHNKIWKQKVDDSGNILSEELVTENHAIMMYNPLLPEK